MNIPEEANTSPKINNIENCLILGEQDNFIKSYMNLTEASKLYNEENDLNSSDSSQANCQNRKNVNNFFLKMDSNHISQKLVKVKSSPLIKPVRHLIKVGLIYEFCKSNKGLLKIIKAPSKNNIKENLF
jgi:hypothetical protein